MKYAASYSYWEIIEADSEEAAQEALRQTIADNIEAKDVYVYEVEESEATK